MLTEVQSLQRRRTTPFEAVITVLMLIGVIAVGSLLEEVMGKPDLGAARRLPVVASDP